MPHMCVNVHLQQETSQPGLHSFLHLCGTVIVSALVSDGWRLFAPRGSVLTVAGLSPLSPQRRLRGVMY